MDLKQIQGILLGSIFFSMIAQVAKRTRHEYDD